MIGQDFFRKESRGVHQAALLLALTSFANGILGLFRDHLLAGTYGASRTLDVYYASFRIPDFIFSLSLFFVASTAFIPIFLERKNISKESAGEFLNSVFTLFLFSMCAIIIVAYFAMPHLIALMAPGFDAPAKTNTVMLARIMLASPLFLGVSNLVSSVLQSSRRFAAYALSPIVYNAGIIFGVLFLYPALGLRGLAFGVILGSMAHLFIQLPALMHLHAVPRLRFSRDAHPFTIFTYSFPRAVALSWNQITLFVLTALASTLGAGAISIFNLANNLNTLPITIIGLSYGIATFPIMAELALKKEKDLFFEHLLTSSRHILLWALPVAGLFIVLRAHIVRLVLGTGAFAWADTRLTAASLLLFAFAIVFQSLITLFVRGYYALGKTREPIVYNIAASLATIIIALISVRVLGDGVAPFLGKILRIHYPADDIRFLSLPFAYMLGSGFNTILLGIGLFKLDEKASASAWVSVKRISFLALLVSLAAYSMLKVLSFMILNTFMGVFIQGGVAGFFALGVGVLFAKIFRVREYQELEQALRSRFLRKPVLQPETEHL